MEAHQWASVALLVTGAGFFLSGTVGMLRFPDTLSRLHALTKADNLGLGIVILGLALLAESPLVAAKLAVIWLLALAASSAAAQLVAKVALAAQDNDDGEARA